MARFTDSKQSPIFLFPIFNILLCTLGSLLLIGGTIISFSLEVSGIIVTNAEVTEVKGMHNKSPVYIEWNGEEIVIHPENNIIYLKIDHFRQEDNNLDKVISNIEHQVQRTIFEDLLSCLASKSNKKYLVILIRPSGFDNFLYLREYIIHKGIDIGYEAIGQHWKLSPSGEGC